MPTQHEDRLGLLVLRASVEQPEKRLVVQVLEIDRGRCQPVVQREDYSDRLDGTCRA